MIFQHIRIRRFGRLHDLDTGEDPLPNLVVVLGSNEAGKTTMFQYLVTLLYGFSPANREQHGYAPWTGEQIDGDATVRLDTGESIRVHRRLLASPWGRLSRGDTLEDIRNNPVPWTAHVQRHIYEQVYALDAGNLARLESSHWNQVQDRLLGAMGAEDLRPTTEVLAEIRAEANRRWRTDRRSRSRAAELQNRRKKLLEELKEARNRDREIREIAADIQRLRARREESHQERTGLQARLKRATLLGPIRAALQRIEGLEEQAGDNFEIVQVPAEPASVLSELENDMEGVSARLQDVAHRRSELESTVAELDHATRRVLDHADVIRRLGKEVAGFSMLEDRAKGMKARVANLTREAESLAREVLRVPWADVDRRTLTSFPTGELRERVRRFREALGEASLLATRAHDRSQLTEETRTIAIWPAGAAMVVGGIAAGIAAAAGQTGLAAMIASLALAGGSAFLALSWRSRREARTRAAGAEAANRDHQAAVARVGELRDATVAVLNPLPVAAARLEEPGPELVQVIASLQRTCSDLCETEYEANKTDEILRFIRNKLNETLVNLGKEVDAEPDSAAAIVALEQDLEQAQERDRAARQARGQLVALEEEYEELTRQRERITADYQDLSARLRKLGDGDLQTGIQQATMRLEARSKAGVLRDELERKYPDLPELLERIRDAEANEEDWSTQDEEEIVQLQHQVDELGEEDTRLAEEIKDAEARMQRLDEETSLDCLESELLVVEEDLEEVRRERDRLMLLASALSKADRDFRDANQPDLLRSAGKYLAHITHDRYQRLFLSDDPADSTLYLEGPGFPQALPADEPISTGTRNQVYLALRLAIMDKLDQANEKLPLFVDEAFINWDPVRLERGGAILRELARQRQIFVFTCHDNVARILAGDNARVLELDRYGGA